MYIYIYIFTCVYIYIYIYSTSLKWYCSTCPLQFRFATTQTLTTSPQAERTVGAPWSIQSQGSHLPTSDSPDQSRAIRCSVAGDHCINRCCPVKCWYTSWSSTFKRVSSIWWHYPVESSPFGFFKKKMGGGTEMLDPPEYILPENWWLEDDPFLVLLKWFLWTRDIC